MKRLVIVTHYVAPKVVVVMQNFIGTRFVRENHGGFIENEIQLYFLSEISNYLS